MSNLAATIQRRTEEAHQHHKRGTRLFAAALLAIGLAIPSLIGFTYPIQQWAGTDAVLLLVAAHVMVSLGLAAASFAADREGERVTAHTEQLIAVELRKALHEAQRALAEAEFNACPHACTDRACHRAIVARRADAVIKARKTPMESR